MAGDAKLQHAEGLGPRFMQVNWTNVRIDTYSLPANITLATALLVEGLACLEDSDYLIASVIERPALGGARTHGPKLFEVRSEYNILYS